MHPIRIVLSGHGFVTKIVEWRVCNSSRQKFVVQVPVCLEEKDFHVILNGILFQGPWTEGSHPELPKWRQSLAIRIAHLCVKDMILQSKLQNGESATLAVKTNLYSPISRKISFWCVVLNGNLVPRTLTWRTLNCRMEINSSNENCGLVCQVSLQGEFCTCCVSRKWSWKENLFQACRTEKDLALDQRITKWKKKRNCGASDSGNHHNNNMMACKCSWAANDEDTETPYVPLSGSFTELAKQLCFLFLKSARKWACWPPTCEHGSALLCTGNAKLRDEGEGKKRRNTDLEAAQREGRVSHGPARSFFLFVYC